MLHSMEEKYSLLAHLQPFRVHYNRNSAFTYADFTVCVACSSVVQSSREHFPLTFALNLFALVRQPVKNLLVDKSIQNEMK